MDLEYEESEFTPKKWLQICLELIVFFGDEILHYDDKEKPNAKCTNGIFEKKYLPYFEGKKVRSI